MPGSRPRFQIASRSAGKSACAMAAYRAGVEIEDQTYQKTHDYRARQGIVLHAEIMAPGHAPEWVFDRATLWNVVEQAELKKDGGLKARAQLAREIVVPLAHELDFETNREMLREWVDQEFVRQGMIADIVIHAPGRTGDQRNIHAHLMLTMREITPDGFKQQKRASKASEWTKKAALERAVSQWEQIQNRELERAGVEARADFRSFEDRGLDRIPEQHEGVAATRMKRAGQETRVGEANDNRRQWNQAQAKRHRDALHALARIEEEQARFADWKVRTAAELESAHRDSLIALERDQLVAELELEERLQAAYGPALDEVETEARRMQQITEGAGVVLSLRRLVRGQRDRQRLEALEATIADAHARMQEQRAAQEKRHQADLRRLAERQRERRRQQRAGLDRKEAEKAAGLAARAMRAAQQARETMPGRGVDPQPDPRAQDPNADPLQDLRPAIEQTKEARETWRERRRKELQEFKIEDYQQGKEKGKGFDFEP